MTLPDFPRGGAWPPSVRTGVLLSQITNETSVTICYPLLRREHYGGTATVKVEEGGGNGRSVCPESPGYTRYKGQDNGLRHRKVKAILNLLVIRLRAAIRPHEAEYVVIAGQHPAVNMPLLSNTPPVKPP